MFVIECSHENDDGVAKKPFDQWIQDAEGSGLEVAYLPLDEKWTINEQYLHAWFDSVADSAYDYAMEFFAAFDDGTMPPPFNSEILPVLLRLD